MTSLRQINASVSIDQFGRVDLWPGQLNSSNTVYSQRSNRLFCLLEKSELFCIMEHQAHSTL